MAQFLFLLTVALVVKASLAAPRIVSVDSLSVSSPINATFKNLLEDENKKLISQLSSGYNDLMDGFLQSISDQTMKGDNDYFKVNYALTAAFMKHEKKAKEFLNGTEPSAECSSLIENVHNRIPEYMQNVTNAFKLRNLYLYEHLSNMTKIRDNTADRVAELLKSCRDENCVEIKKAESHDVVTKALDNLEAAMKNCEENNPIHTEVYQNAVDDDKLSTRYEKEVQQNFDDFRNCVKP